jgi:hypothetical protein
MADIYGNLDKLYGTQQQAAGFMLDQAMPRIPGVFDTSEALAQEATSGRLGDRMASRAVSDTVTALDAGRAARERNLFSMGVDPSDSRYGDSLRRNAISDSLAKAGAAQSARTWAEDQKWNRNAGYLAQVSGLGSGAMSGMSSAGAGLSGMAARQSDMDRLNAQGMGAAVGTGLGYAMRKDGGKISRRKGKPAKLANGGNAWEAYKGANPVVSSGRSKSGVPSTGKIVAQAALPHLIGDALRGSKGKIYSAAKGWMDTPAAGVIDKATLATDSMEKAAGGMDAIQAAADASDASDAADLGTSITSAMDVADTAQAADSASAAWGAIDSASPLFEFAADGGVMRTRPGYAMGGVVNPLAGRGTSGMDTSGQMSVVGLANKRVKAPGTPAAAPGSEDPDGFGTYHPDMREQAGAQVISKYTFGLGKPIAKALSPVMEPVTRGVLREADNIGGAGLAVLTDPVGAASSGKYSPEQIASATADPLGTGVGDKVTKELGRLGKKLGFKHGGVVNPVAGRGTSGMDASDQMRVADMANKRMVAPASGQSQEAMQAAKEDAENKLIAALAGTATGVPFGGRIATELGGDRVVGELRRLGKRLGMERGGKVRGPGTATSDSIPAMLSDGEVVHNTEAVKLAGEDALLAINEAGKDVRYGKKSPAQARLSVARVMTQRGSELAKGGTKKEIAHRRNGPQKKFAWGGVAMGAAADAFNQQRRLGMEERGQERADAAGLRDAARFENEQTTLQKARDLEGRINALAARTDLNDEQKASEVARIKGDYAGIVTAAGAKEKRASDAAYEKSRMGYYESEAEKNRADAGAKGRIVTGTYVNPKTGETIVDYASGRSEVLEKGWVPAKARETEQRLGAAVAKTNKAEQGKDARLDKQLGSNEKIAADKLAAKAAADPLARYFTK